MRFFTFLGLSAGLVAAATLPVSRDSEAHKKDSQCENGPNTRACWSDGYSIATDFDTKWPSTGVTVTYNLELTNTTCNPDGHGERVCLLINGQYPGPTIEANWGDHVVVNVKNSLPNNGTAIHFHGVRQYQTFAYDGVAGITQCPIAPGDSMTYEFQATQYGSAWYHSHFSVQYGDGIAGAIVFNGPATANYDVDLGPYPVTDWYYDTAYQINAITDVNLQNRGQPPVADTILINGTNKDAAGAGQYSVVKVTSGKRYRLRLINEAVDNSIRVSLDNHQFQIIASDFTPIKPIYASTILMAIGQRYDVIITANQTAGNYWFRANTSTDCAASNHFYGLAVFSYDSVAVADPTTTPSSFIADCRSPSPLTPFWEPCIPSNPFTNASDILDSGLTTNVVVPGGHSVVVWALEPYSIDVNWSMPTLSYIMEGDTTQFPKNLSVIPTLAEGKWNYWLLQQPINTPPLPHPMHLHGHDFWVIGSGNGTYNSSTASLNFKNPTRRDTVFMPNHGWVALAWESDNPGSWLMHCHIAWHISEGMGVQFIEAPGSINFPPKSQYDGVCNNWNAYAPTAVYPKDDSGV